MGRMSLWAAGSCWKLQETKSPRSWRRGSKTWHREGANPRFTCGERGKPIAGVNEWPFAESKLFCLYSHHSVFGPVCFFSFSVFVCMVALVNLCKETRTGGLVWTGNGFVVSSLQLGASSADGSLLLFEQLCSGPEIFPLLLRQCLFGRVWGPAMYQ